MSGDGSNVRRMVNFETSQEYPNVYPGALLPKRIGGGFFRGDHCNFTPQNGILIATISFPSSF
jgi:hypothetical protein